jgi:hypothetical protein
MADSQAAYHPTPNILSDTDGVNEQTKDVVTIGIFKIMCAQSNNVVHVLISCCREEHS